MKIYGLKTCSTCRKALKVLRANGHEAEIVDVRADGIDGELLEKMHVIFGEALLNKRSTAWRKLTDVEKTRKPVQLMLAHPLLMKRPLIVEDGGLVTLGWGEDQQKMWAEKGSWFTKGVGTAPHSS